MNRWRARGGGLVLLAAVAAVVGLGGWSSGGGLDARTGVSRAPSGEIRLHYALCEGERMDLIRVEDLVGGRRTAYGAPIHWQIESAGADVPDPLVVGAVPPGWTETVPYRGPLTGGDLLGIEATRPDMGMSFAPDRLGDSLVLRGTYDSVPLERFRADAAACRAVRWGALVTGMLALLVAAVALAALWWLHRTRPASWGDRQARRLWIWVVAIGGGSFWTVMLFSVRAHDVDVGETVGATAMLLIPAVLSALVVVPVVAVAGLVGRRLPGPSRRPVALIGATAAGALLWWIPCGLDGRWLPLAVAVTVALAAMTPATTR